MNRSIVLLTGILGTFLAASFAAASPIFTLGNHPQSGEENILFKKGTTGTTVTGTTNTSGITVDFSSKQTLTEPSSGQARVTATSGSITNITISIPGGSYTDLIINPFNGGTAAGMANVSVVANDGTFAFSYSLGVGNNFLTITTSPGETISSTTLSVANGFGDLRQPRISGATVGGGGGAGGNGGVAGSVVPEPASVLLWAVLGLALVGAAVRRYLQNRVATGCS
jgi:hypothetical protein